MKTGILILLLLASAVLPQRTPVKVAAAANMQFAIREIARAFEASSGIPVNITIGASGMLTAQIFHGAGYDLFLSADMRYPDTLFAAGRGASAPRVYAQGELLFWTRHTDGPADSLLSSLCSPKIVRIAVANPRIAPYGAATVQAFKRSGHEACAAGKQVFGRNISQVLHIMKSGAVDAAITAKSLMAPPGVPPIAGRWVPVAGHLYDPVDQGVLLIKKDTPPTEAAQQFYTFLFSPASRTILKRQGYRLP